MICADSDWQSIALESQENLSGVARGDSAAYVGYTSGSTGVPKGVVVPHRAICRLVVNTDYLQLQPSDIVAQVSNPAFDAITFEAWGPLLNGARTAIIPRDVVLSPVEFAAELDRQGVTVLFLTTALFNLMAREAPSAFTNLRCLLFGGETADPKWAREILRHGAPGRLLHVYGPTETTTFALWYPVEQVADDATSIPIGRPIANTQIYLLDQFMNPVPIGVPGELYIGGPGLALGYHNDAELTLRRFIPNPFGNGLGSRLYRTGDIARYRSDGNIEFLGRLDNQVKLRGFRIELEEIEVALSQHPAVATAAVLLREDQPGEKRLVAYVVPVDASGVTTGELRHFLKQRLPGYMVPSNYIVLDTLPLTPNGKVDRRALPAPDREQDISPPTSNETTDDVEERLIQIWERVLGTRPINPSDDFFELGGHSLLAILMFSEVERVFGRRIPLSTLLESATIAHLSTVIRQGESSLTRASLVPIQPNGSNPPFFCVHPVDGELFVYRELAGLLGPDQPFYGLQAPDPDERYPLPTSVQDIAKRYIQELRTVQPKGPYYLGGFSLGGTIVFEMAQQLHSDGQQVALLAIFDHGPRMSHSRLAELRKPAHAALFLSNIYYLWSDFWHQSPDERFDTISRWTRYLWYRLTTGLGLRSDTDADKAKMANAIDFFHNERLSMLPEHRRQIVEALRQAVRDYTPRTYPGRVTLFRARRQPVFRWREPNMGWGRLAQGGVEVIVVPGFHQTVLREPNISVLADKLRARLPKATPNASDGET